MEKRKKGVDLYCPECVSELEPTDNDLIYRCIVCEENVNVFHALKRFGAYDRLEYLVKEVENELKR